MDFSGQHLRGRNFRGQDLTGANFLYADIRGANFSNAILKGANFTGAKAGLQKRWVVCQLLISLMLLFLSGILSSVSGWFAAYFFQPKIISQSTIISAGVSAILLFVLVKIVHQGFTVQAFGTIASIVTALAAGEISAAVVNKVFGDGIGDDSISIVIPVAGAITAAVISFVISAVFSNLADSFYISVTFIISGSITGAVAVTSTANAAIAVVAAVTVALLSFYAAWRSLKGDEKFDLTRTIAITLGAIGGTSFCGADLTGADFTKAILKSTNFNHTKQKQTILHQVCWSEAVKLDRARLGTSILANPDVRQLLVTRNGYKKSYANLDLSNVNLRGANLNHANLTKTLAVGADFNQACLTGACLESWNIDHTTKLDHVDCQYVFLLEQPNKFGSRERRPHDSDKVFQPGDFEKLYAKIMTTMQLLLRNGVNPEAFAVAFQKLMQENPDISPDSVQAIEKKGNDVLVTLQISEGTDKGKLEHTFDTAYQAKLEAQKNAELLESEKRHNQELNHLALTLAQNTNLGNLLSNLTIVAGNDNTMTDNKNQGINTGANSFVNTGTNKMINSILNMSGAVTNALNQLPNTTTEEPGIKELLTQLQTAIESDPELSEKGKTNALEQVKTLAEVGQNPEQLEKKNLGEKAMIFLKGTIATLSDTAKLAEAAKVLLPLIAKALGLPV
ncbi:pentapeptide repeat-containing protein [Phormidesmis sp. 146-35]